MDDAEVGFRLTRVLITLLLSLALAVAAHPAENPKGKITFNLPSDEFPKAIIEFYHQSKIEVLFLSNDALRHNAFKA